MLRRCSDPLQFSRNPKVAEHVGAVAGRRGGEGASIQPQPKGRGTLHESWLTKTQTGMLQFSRNPKVAEHFPRRVSSTEEPRCFNSAATQRSRNTPFISPSRGRGMTLQFSRNPKVAEHEQGPATVATRFKALQFSRNPKVAEHLYPARRTPANKPLLQFSRNPKVAEHARRSDALLSPSTLQFSRNPKVAEHLDVLGPLGADSDASIQPQPKGRGTPRRRNPCVKGLASFNSAATQRSRNTTTVGDS